MIKRKKRRENMSKRELQIELNSLQLKKKELKKEEQQIKERIDHINSNIEESEENPELYQLEEMLTMFYKQKHFDIENFSAKEAVKKFRSDNNNIADFIARNQPS